jgi:hypothetical protein
MRTAVLAAALTFALAGPAFATTSPYQARWTVVEAGPGGAVAYAPASVERDEKAGAAYLTALIGLAKPGAFDGRPVDFLIVETQFDCKAARWRRGAKIGISADLKPVGADETIEAWRPIADGTYAAGVRAYACKGIAPGKPMFEGSWIDTVLMMRKALPR